MAKTREQYLQEQLGTLMFQLALVTADLEAAREELAQLKAAQKPPTPDPAIQNT